MNALTMILLLVGLWSVACRLYKMDPDRTIPEVFWKYFALGCGLLGGLLFSPPFAKAALAIGIAGYLLAGAHSWKYAQPRDTQWPEDE